MAQSTDKSIKNVEVTEEAPVAQAPLVAEPTPPTPAVFPVVENSDAQWYSYFWLSIVALFSILWPLGIASLFIGQRGITHFEAGKIAQAEKDRQTSILLSVISIGGTAIIFFILFLKVICSGAYYYY